MLSRRERVLGSWPSTIVKLIAALWVIWRKQNFAYVIAALFLQYVIELLKFLFTSHV